MLPLNPMIQKTLDDLRLHIFGRSKQYGDPKTVQMPNPNDECAKNALQRLANALRPLGWDVETGEPATAYRASEEYLPLSILDN